LLLTVVSSISSLRVGSSMVQGRVSTRIWRGGRGGAGTLQVRRVVHALPVDGALLCAVLCSAATRPASLSRRPLPLGAGFLGSFGADAQAVLRLGRPTSPPAAAGPRRRTFSAPAP
jgi:hypothetical protein